MAGNIPVNWIKWLPWQMVSVFEFYFVIIRCKITYVVWFSRMICCSVHKQTGLRFSLTLKCNYSIISFVCWKAKDTQIKHKFLEEKKYSRLYFLRTDVAWTFGFSDSRDECLRILGIPSEMFSVGFHLTDWLTDRQTDWKKERKKARKKERSQTSSKAIHIWGTLWIFFSESAAHVVEKLQRHAWTCLTFVFVCTVELTHEVERTKRITKVCRVGNVHLYSYFPAQAMQTVAAGLSGHRGTNALLQHLAKWIWFLVLSSWWVQFGLVKLFVCNKLVKKKLQTTLRRSWLQPKTARVVYMSEAPVVML